MTQEIIKILEILSNLEVAYKEIQRVVLTDLSQLENLKKDGRALDSKNQV